MANDKVIGDIIKGVSAKNIESAKSSLSHMGDGSSAFKISYYVTDENTKKYISELGLDNPQKLAMFLVDVGFSAVEVIISSANEIKADIMNDHLSKIRSIKQKIKHNIGSDDANERLREYQDELIDLRNVFETRVSENIQRISKVDNMSPLERKIKSAFIIKDVDSYTKSAQMSLQAVLEIAKLQIHIADYIGDANFDTIRCDIDDFMNQVVFKGNTISLMNDWATKEDRDFWSDKLRNDYTHTIEQHGELMELFSDLRNVATEQNVDLENIIFE